MERGLRAELEGRLYSRQQRMKTQPLDGEQMRQEENWKSTQVIEAWRRVFPEGGVSGVSLC